MVSDWDEAVTVSTSLAMFTVMARCSAPTACEMLVKPSCLLGCGVQVLMMIEADVMVVMVGVQVLVMIEADVMEVMVVVQVIVMIGVRCNGGNDRGSGNSDDRG